MPDKIERKVIELELIVRQEFLRQYEESVVRAARAIKEAEYRQIVAAAHRDATMTEIAKLKALLDA